MVSFVSLKISFAETARNNLTSFHPLLPQYFGAVLAPVAVCFARILIFVSGTDHSGLNRVFTIEISIKALNLETLLARHWDIQNSDVEAEHTYSLRTSC